MIHEETTTEIELPGYERQRTRQVVQVQFPKKRLTVKRALPHLHSSETTKAPKDWRSRFQIDWDTEAPWVWRLVGVLAVLVLSMLVL